MAKKQEIPEDKKCIGKGRAENYEGCGEYLTNKKYALCSSCLEDFILNTKEGQEILNAVI
jgi:hypothetical protein